MVDARFFSNAGPFSLAGIVEITGAAPADGVILTHMVHDVAPLDRAGENDISFLDNAKYIDLFGASKAGACFVRPKLAARAPVGMALLLCDDPYYCYALTANRFYPKISVTPGISPLAIIDPSARLGKEVCIEAGAVIDRDVVIGHRCIIKANAVLHSGVMMGDDCSIGACSTVSHAVLGNRVILHRGVHIGQDGFGYAQGKAGPIKVPQLGRVVVEDDVEIGSGTCIDRGTGPDTFIGTGAKIDNLVQIGHNVHIGKYCIVVAQVGIAGSTRIGDGAMLGGQVGIAGHIKIGTGAKLAAQSGIMADIPNGAAYGGYPAVPIKDWHRQTLAVSKLIKRKDGSHDE